MMSTVNHLNNKLSQTEHKILRNGKIIVNTICEILRTLLIRTSDKSFKSISSEKRISPTVHERHHKFYTEIPHLHENNTLLYRAALLAQSHPS